MTFVSLYITSSTSCNPDSPTNCPFVPRKLFRYERRQRSVKDTIKYHTKPRTQYGKLKKTHTKTPHTREPRGQPFYSRWLQGCKEPTSQYERQTGNTNNTVSKKYKLLLESLHMFDGTKVIRLQRSGIDTIKYHTWPRIPMGKWQTHRRHHKREPRGQPFPSRWPQSTYKQTRTKHSKHKTEQKHKRSTKEVPPWNGQ